MPFYIFWAIILLLTIIVAIIVISSISPNFRFSFLKLRHFVTDSTNVATQPHISGDRSSDSKSEDSVAPLNSTNSDNSMREENIQNMSSASDFTDILSSVGDDNDEERQSSLFAQAQFISAPKFLSRDGKKFFAGSLEIQGQFPHDFQDSDSFINFMEKYSFDTSIPVRIVIDIGWNDLLSFADISKILNPSSRKSLLPPIEIPSLTILNILVSVPSNFSQENTRTTRAIDVFVKKHLRTLFDMHNFSADVLSEIQQELAVAYVSHGYEDIVLVSSQKE